MGIALNKISTDKRVWFGMLETRGDHHTGEIVCGYLKADGRIYMFIENGSELEHIGTMFGEVIRIVPEYFEVIINISTKDYTTEINDMQAYLRRTRVFLGEIPEAVLAVVLQRHYRSSTAPVPTVCSDGRTMEDLKYDTPFTLAVSSRIRVIKENHARKKRLEEEEEYGISNEAVGGTESYATPSVVDTNPKISGSHIFNTK